MPSIGEVIERARERLKNRPQFIEELEWTGRERALIYKTLVMTGLRRGELASIEFRQLQLDTSPALLTLDPEDEKNREGNTIPLRDDLATELRAWIADRTKPLRSQASLDFKVAKSGQALAADALLFAVPSGLLRIMNRDLAAAGISKVDQHGETLDIHALRKTFGTHLCKAGVPLRTAQIAMRHSTPTLTANHYTDPRLLDVHGAVESLPSLTVDVTSATPQTGTYGRCPPLFPPGTGIMGHLESSAVAQGVVSIVDDGVGSVAVTSMPVNKKAPPSSPDNEGHQVGMTRFERATSCSQSRRSTKLSYIPQQSERGVYERTRNPSIPAPVQSHMIGFRE